MGYGLALALELVVTLAEVQVAPKTSAERVAN